MTLRTLATAAAWLAIAASCLTAPALARNVSVTSQNGGFNSSGTFQSGGSNSSGTFQNGYSNSAGTFQRGNNNSSGTFQNGGFNGSTTVQQSGYGYRGGFNPRAPQPYGGNAQPAGMP